MQILNFINGSPAITENTFEKLNPFTGEILYKVNDSSVIDLVTTIAASQKVFLQWKNTLLPERLTILEKIISVYVTKKKKIIEAESLDQGLPIFFTEKANYSVGLAVLENLRSELKSAIANTTYNINYQAVGVISVVLSWNLSNRIFIEKVISAILAGNVAIVKCSSLAPATGQIWSEIFTEIELPAGVVQILNGQSKSFKELLINHPGIKAVSFTGTLQNSTEVLNQISKISDRQFKKIQIFSGAKNSGISLIEPSSNHIDQVLESMLIGQGQLAWNTARLFILEKHNQSWKEFILEKLNKLTPLESIEGESLWTPILKKLSREHFLEIENQAYQDQAKLIRNINFKIQSERFLLPTFTQDMSRCSTLQQDQVLAPLFILSEVKYPFDIPKYSNVSYYGHSASLWSDDFEKVKSIINQLDVGLVSLNEWSIYNKVSFSPVKQSGFGLTDNKIFGAFNSNVKIVTFA